MRKPYFLRFKITIIIISSEKLKTWLNINDITVNSFVFVLLPF